MSGIRSVHIRVKTEIIHVKYDLMLNRNFHFIFGSKYKAHKFIFGEFSILVGYEDAALSASSFSSGSMACRMGDGREASCEREQGSMWNDNIPTLIIFCPTLRASSYCCSQKSMDILSYFEKLAVISYLGLVPSEPT